MEIEGHIIRNGELIGVSPFKKGSIDTNEKVFHFKFKIYLKSYSIHIKGTYSYEAYPNAEYSPSYKKVLNELSKIGIC